MIAIIAILAALLFPVFAKAKAAAAIASCESNVKQIGSAIVMYADANGGRVPKYDNSDLGGSGATRLMWWDFIKPYLKGDRTYRCPALLFSKSTDTSAGPMNRIWGYGVPVPHLFHAIQKNSSDPTKRTTARLSSVSRPSKVMMLCDAYTQEGPNEVGYPVVYCRGPHTGTPYDLTTQKNQYTPDGGIAGRHGGISDWRNPAAWGKTVVLYCDLHVRPWPKQYVEQRYSTLAESRNMDIFGHFDDIQ